MPAATGASVRVMQPGTDLSGSFDTLPLPDLLAFLAGQGRTGVLDVRGGVDAKLMLVDGLVALGLSADGPSLQQVIVGSGLADSAGWSAAADEARRTGSIADALVDAGTDPDRLGHVLREQCIGVVFELLLPDAATFHLAVGETHPIGARYLFDGAELITEARERLESWRPIARSVPSTSAVLRPVRHLDAEEVTVAAGDWAILALLDGHRTVADLIAELGVSAFVVCAQLHRLRESGLVEQTS